MTSAGLPVDALMRAQTSLPDDALTEARRRALERFVETGFPTTRQEDWKYTDLTPVVEISRRSLESDSVASSRGVIDDRIQRVRSAIDADWIVIADGHIAAAHDEALAVSGAVATKLLDPEMLADIGSGLPDLNIALLRDGLHLRIPKAQVLERPIGLLLIDSAQSSASMSQSRVIIEAESGSSARIIEYHVSVGAAEQYSNSVVRIELAIEAALEHVRIQERDIAHSQTARCDVRLAADSSYSHWGFDLGGKLVRNDLNIDIEAPGAETAVNSLYLAGTGQHIDNHVRIDHRVGPAHSSQTFRGILSGRCRCVWNGKAVVHEGADGTDAEQENHNLLLSEGAEIDAKPELEIYADEVKCSHGTTVGQLDDAALFYLRARGLDRQQARRVLTRAFGASIVSSLHDPSLEATLSAIVESRLATIAEGEFQ